MVEHATEVQVRWSDVDPAGVVFYPRFFEWYDLGCESLFASLGLPWPDFFIEKHIHAVPLLWNGKAHSRRVGERYSLSSRPS